MPNREKDPKPTPEEYRKLIETYNIHFDGPIPSSTWPVEYGKIFQNIRDIERLRFDEYGPNEKRGLLPVAEMKDRVARVNRIAFNCRRQLENEATWRAHAEPEIFSRFDAEVVCSTCRRRLWLSEFQALPDDTLEAEMLRQRRAKRTLCMCSLTARAKEDLNEQGQSLLFSNRIQWRILHDPAEKLTRKGVKKQEPDRVYGLSQTKVFSEHLYSQPGLRHSPFKDGNVLYPFLIIEAKSEKGSPGFQSVESQTAFPIRTLLKIQQDLACFGETTFNPLVWFMAYQGDEWRVYASIPDGSRVRIIDLWHGTILSQDRALQLLLIIDYICDWARDVYRFNVLRCLAGGDVSMRDFTPAHTMDLSQLYESTVPPSSSTATTLTPSSPEISELIDLTSDLPEDDAEMQDCHLDEGNNEVVSLVNPIDHHSLLRFSSTHNTSPWSKHATIRHSNLVLFSFHHFAVPEDRRVLETCLNSFGMSGGIPQAAKCLLELFEEANAVTIPTDGIHQLENLWTRNGPRLVPGKDCPIRARIMFRTYLEVNDWHLVRELSCATSSLLAIRELMKIADKEWPTPPNNWEFHRCPCLIADAEILRSLFGKDSMVSAANNLCLRLEPSDLNNAEAHLRWVGASDIEDLDSRSHFWTALGLGRFSHESTLGPHTLSLHKSSVLEEVRPGTSIPTSLAPLLPMRSKSFKNGAILLKKSLSSPESCPTFCFLVFDNASFDDESGLGDKIIRACNSGHFYIGSLNGGELKKIHLSESDEQAVRLWADILMMIEVPDAEWPL